VLGRRGVSTFKLPMNVGQVQALIRAMSTFSLLLFQGSRLIGAEKLEAPSVLNAIESCSARNRTCRVELWADGKMAAILRPAIGRHGEDG
jgi:hypothetical protein